MTDFTKPQKFKATVKDKVQLTQVVYVARYALEEPKTMTFFAGQTIMLTVAPGVFRPMSIASPPQEDSILTSYQSVAPGGPGSQWMIALKAGDPVEFTGPLGRFVVDHDSPRKKVFIATGTGIAPFRSMLLDTTDLRAQSERVSLYWGLRHKDDMYLHDELLAIDRGRDSLVYIPTLSQPSEGWTGCVGHVTDAVFAQESDLTQCDFYLCGNKKMIVEMQTRLTQAGIPADRMKFDPFF